MFFLRLWWYTFWQLTGKIESAENKGRNLAAGVCRFFEGKWIGMSEEQYQGPEVIYKGQEKGR